MNQFIFRMDILAMLFLLCLNPLNAQTALTPPSSTGVPVLTPTMTYREQQIELINRGLERVRDPKAIKIIRQWIKKWAFPMECKDVSAREISPGIVSVGIYGFQSTEGGALASVVAYKDRTFSTTTGKVFDISDLFLPHTYWSKVLWHHVYVKEKSCPYMPEAAIRELSSKEYKSFYLDNQNLVLDFDQCDLLPCICCGLQVKIPIKEIKSIIKPEFISITDQGDSSETKP